MQDSVSFTHVLNPFPAKTGSEHAIASAVTWQTLRVAHARAVTHGLDVDCSAVILPGDEGTVEGPATRKAYLMRTVQDVEKLKPIRPLPLIADLLNAGVIGSTSSHIVFSNMDISVQPDFYLTLRNLVSRTLGVDVPFTVPRINIDASLAGGTLEEMYAASGPLGHGYDCFVIPRGMINKLDLGSCCIGAPHFDQLLFMALDVLSGHRAKSMNDLRLTFHLGNDIAWAAMMDYVEHNLLESLAAISRMKARNNITPLSAFDRLDKRHFQRNAQLSSVLLRKVRRIPGLSSVILGVKRAIGRQY
jgi:hypothetical protein